MHHRCTGHANQIAMARNHVEDHSRHAHTLAHASSAVSRSADFGAASPSLPLKGKAAGYGVGRTFNRGRLQRAAIGRHGCQAQRAGC